MNNLMFMTSYLFGKMRKIYFMALPENKQDFKKSRVCFTIGDSAAQTIVQLVGGTFIVTLMSFVGISDANIGIITSLASLAAIFQLLTMQLVNRLPKYKFFVCFTVLLKLLFAGIYFVPLFGLTRKAKVVWIITGFFIAQVGSLVGNPAIQDWIASLVPSRLRGRYLSIKDSVAVFVTVSVMLVAGVVLDCMKKHHMTIGFAIIGTMIFILVVINLIAFSFMKEPRVSYIDINGKEMHGKLAKKAKSIHQKEQKTSLITEITAAFTYPLFRKVLYVQLLWMTSFFIAAPFNASYQIKELALPYTYLMVISFLCNMVRIYIMPKIGRLADRLGMARVLKYALLALGVNYILITCSVPSNAYVMMVIASLCGACAWSFIGIGLFGIQLEFLTVEKRMIQLSIISAIGGVHGFLVSLIGGKILDYIQRVKPIWFGRPIYGQQVLNVVGFIMLLITVIYIKIKIQPIKVRVSPGDGKL